MEGLRPQEAGRPYIAAMHAGRRAGHWPLGMQSKHHYGLRKSAHTSPARTAGKPTQSRQGREKRAQRTTATSASIQWRGSAFALVAQRAAHSGDRSSCTLLKVGAVVPQTGTNDIAGWPVWDIGSAACCVAVSRCSHAVTRVFNFSQHRRRTLWDWAASSLLSNAGPVAPVFAGLWDSFLRRQLENKWISRQASVIPGPETAVNSGEDQTSVGPRS